MEKSEILGFFYFLWESYTFNSDTAFYFCFSVRGEISPELFRFNVQLNTIIGTIFFTSMILCGTQARQEFIQKNKTTVFLTKGLATVS